MLQSIKKYFLYPLRGIVNLFIVLFVTIFLPICIYTIAFVVWIIPNKSWKRRGMLFLQRFSVYWIDVVFAMVYWTSYKKWDISGPKSLRKDQSYLLISNHVGWMDIFILSYALHRKTPPIKFFLKKQLLWTLPFAGLATYILGYPFMERPSSSQIRKNPNLRTRDVETTRKACEKIKIYPTTLINYVEGTRFSEEKRLRKNSPYRNLLPPKAGGLATVLEVLQGHLAGVINATIVHKPKVITLWQFCCGNFDKIICHYEVIPIDQVNWGHYHENREDRIQFQAWLNTLWREKDDFIDKVKSHP